MNEAIPLQVPRSPSDAGLQQRRAQAAGRAFRERVLWLVLLCAVPAAGLLALGRLGMAANVFWFFLGGCAAWLVITARHDTLLALLLGVTPLINLLRGHGLAPYNATLMVLLGVLGFMAWRTPRRTMTVWRDFAMARWLVALVIGYYGLSLFNTGDYARNLRFFELCLAVFAVLLAARNREVLGAGLLGLTLTAIGVGFAMLPHHGSFGRLGIALIGGQIVGNPVQLGVALALGFLALTVDRGCWLGRFQAHGWKWLLVAPAIVLLALTTSRAAWLVTAGGLLFGLLFGRGQRGRMLIVVGAIGVGVMAVLASPFGASLRAGIMRTFNEERSLGNRTSGRSDQWQVAWAATTATPERLAFGYGPGRGPAVYARFSDDVPEIRYSAGQEVALHSLFMQVMVEAGLVGLAVLLAWLGVLGGRVIGWTRRDGRLLPLVCIGAYVLVILTVSGNDMVSGVALGTALLATGRPS